MGIYKKALEDFISEKGEDDIVDILDLLFREGIIEMVKYNIGERTHILLRSKPEEGEKGNWITKKGYMPDDFKIWVKGFGWIEKHIHEQISREQEYKRKQQNEPAST